jgi:hypothetical protein
MPKNGDGAQNPEIFKGHVKKLLQELMMISDCQGNSTFAFHLYKDQNSNRLLAGAANRSYRTASFQLAQINSLCRQSSSFNCALARLRISMEFQFDLYTGRALAKWPVEAAGGGGKGQRSVHAIGGGGPGRRNSRRAGYGTGSAPRTPRGPASPPRP